MYLKIQYDLPKTGIAQTGRYDTLPEEFLPRHLSFQKTSSLLAELLIREI